MCIQKVNIYNAEAKSLFRPKSSVSSSSSSLSSRNVSGSTASPYTPKLIRFACASGKFPKNQQHTPTPTLLPSLLINEVVPAMQPTVIPNFKNREDSFFLPIESKVHRNTNGLPKQYNVIGNKKEKNTTLTGLESLLEKCEFTAEWYIRNH